MSLHNYQFIITVNQRLARELKGQYTAEQIASQRQVWESTQILPWSAWLKRLWRTELQPDVSEILLNQSQTRVIWENIINRSSAALGVVPLSQTTRLAMEAWRLLYEWQIPIAQIERLAPEFNLDVQAFAEWSASVEKILQQKHWITLEQLPSVMLRQCQSGQLPIPENMLLAGFDQLTPQQTALKNCLIEAGCQVEFYKPRIYTNVAQSMSCRNSEHEINVAAHYSRYLLNQDPNIRIGIVVPDLEKRKAQLEAVFADALTPGAHLPGAQIKRPFNVSLGQPLSSVPLIRTAFLILKAACETLSLEDLSRLIRSPYISAGEAEINQRALLDARLRQYGSDTPALSLLIREARAVDQEGVARHWNCPVLASVLEKFQRLTDQMGKYGNNIISEWYAGFVSLLECTGWPGERSLSSEEYQSQQAWLSLCEEFIRLETVLASVSYQTALHHLQKIASEQIFQAESDKVPVQIMGMLEATDLQFDHLLVLGLTDERWPARAAANPFLPKPLQMQKRMPFASADMALNMARLMTDRLACSAPSVIFSYSLQDADQDMRPSPLLTDFPAIKAEQLLQIIPPAINQQTGLTTDVETCVDNQAPPLAGQVAWKGGASLFRDQAACPFRAFARHRLQAESLGTVEPGLSPAERGSLVHAALEVLWGELESQQNLLRLNDQEIDQLVCKAAAAALQDHLGVKSETSSGAFRNLELNRLQHLLRDWLVIEREREPFRVVDREKDLSFSLAGLQLRTRVDRIDQLEGNDLAVIDYKTGTVTTESWLGDRPDEPQLPLYAVAMPVPPQAVLFGVLKKGNQGYIGLSSNRQTGKKIKLSEDWDAQLTSWRVVLEHLAEQFRQGLAVVNPKDHTSCQYCDLQRLCRIDELCEWQGKIPVVEDD